MKRTDNERQNPVLTGGVGKDKSIRVNMHAEISQFRVNIMISVIHRCGSSSQDFVKCVFFIFIIFL